MNSGAGDGARRLGETLGGEVEIDDLSTILRSLKFRLASKSAKYVPNFYFNFTTFVTSVCFTPSPLTEISDNENNKNKDIFFGIPELDELFYGLSSQIIELVSPTASHSIAGAGKTALLQYIVAHAILPATTTSIASVKGQNGAIILLDPLHRFSISRLASDLANLLLSERHESSRAADMALKSEVKSFVKASLLHLHIFRPQSWDSFVATLHGLSDYLLNGSKHQSMHRRVHSIILEDMDTYVWSIRNSGNTASAIVNPLTEASSVLTSTLSRLSKSLSCRIILASKTTSPNSVRPPMPISWPQAIPVIRIVVEKVEVLKFAPAISVEEAEAEKQERWHVVQQGRFKCWKIEQPPRGKDGFVFTVSAKGLVMEK